MQTYRQKIIIGIAAGLGIASCCSSPISGQPLDAIADNDGFFIDGAMLKVVPGRAKGDAAKLIDKLGARELGRGTLIFRSGHKLYIVETPPLAVTGTADPKGRTIDVDEERTHRIRVEYVPPKNPDHQAVYDLVRERKSLDTLQQIFSPLRLPVDVTIKTIGCDGVPNAWYDRKGENPIISLCYEYLQEILQKMPTETTPAGFSPHDTVVGQFFYAALHELGHAVFDLYDVPVFGREEDAADQFAAYVMLQFRNNQARRLIGGAAYSYVEFMKGYQDKPNVTVPLLAFSSNHGSPQERFYNLLCIAYGFDDKLFADAVDKQYLPRSRAAGCKYEYQVLRYAFRSQISPHIDQQMAQQVLGTTWFAQPIKRPRAER